MDDRSTFQLFVVILNFNLFFACLRFMLHLDLKLDDLPGALFFNQNVLRDIALKLGGNPFDNTQTLYSGYPDNVLVNETAENQYAGGADA